MAFRSAEAVKLMAEAIGQERLVIISDYDGTLNSTSTHPRPVPGAVDVLCKLARLRHTSVVILTGRERASLSRLLRADNSHFVPDSLRLADGDGLIYSIGHHGAELDPDLGGMSSDLTSQDLERRRSWLESRLRERLAAEFPNVPVVAEPDPNAVNSIYLARKPLSIAVCLNRFKEESQSLGQQVLSTVMSLYEQFAAEVEQGPLRLHSSDSIHEISLVVGDKGDGLSLAKNRLGECVLFLGDDLSDLAAFDALGPTDIGVVVGSKLRRLVGTGCAETQLGSVADAEQAVSFLSAVADERAAARRTERTTS